MILVAIKRTANSFYFYYKKDENSNASVIGDISPLYLSIFKPIDEIVSPTENVYFADLIAISMNTSRAGRYEAIRFYVDNQGNLLTETNTPGINALTTIAQSIYGEKSFNDIPKISSYYAPTQNTQLVPKKYVDDSISNKFWIGTKAEYDAITTKDANVLYFIQEV